MNTAIPPVSEQLKQWGRGRSVKDAEPQRETIAARNLKLLGSVGRSQFATARDGRELRRESSRIADDLMAGLFECHEDPRLMPLARPVHQGLQRKDGFAGAGPADQQRCCSCGQAAVSDGVEALDTGGRFTNSH